MLASSEEHCLRKDLRDTKEFIVSRSTAALNGKRRAKSLSPLSHKTVEICRPPGLYCMFLHLGCWMQKLHQRNEPSAMRDGYFLIVIKRSNNSSTDCIKFYICRSRWTSYHRWGRDVPNLFGVLVNSSVTAECVGACSIHDWHPRPFLQQKWERWAVRNTMTRGNLMLWS
jgi:hypothetical protein